MRFLFLAFLLIGFKVFGNLSAFHDSTLDNRLNVVKNNREGKRIFFETGTAGGGGVYMAILAGYEEIYSGEINPELYNCALSRLKEERNVHLYLGDSAQILERVLPLIDEPVLFWLDAHCPGEGLHLSENCPVLRELQAIGAHSIKTHTILVDDVRVFGTHFYDYIPLSAVVDAIMKINPDYVISFEDGFVKNDVLVAKILPK
ncbi:MAG TPA: hypothetical protein VLE89_04225 [Chlamydiales bacterium]|nr:hypothetical protein [Chlamydiales bacterium]